MDPNFVQHTLADVTTRFVGMLGMLMGFSIPLYAVLRVLFETPWYNRTFGKGWDDDGVSIPSRFFPNCDPRAWISMCIGWFIGIGLNVNMWFYMAGLTDGQVSGAQGAQAELGIVAGFIPFWLLVFVLNSLSGLAIGMGPKVIISMAKTWQNVKNQIATIFQK